MPVTAESYHYEFMGEAIGEAEIDLAEGGLPIGAVLTRNEIIACGHNRRVQGHDLADERSVNMMKLWRSMPANERLWQGDIGN